MLKPESMLQSNCGKIQIIHARQQTVLRRQFGRSASLRQRRVGETSENAEHEQIRGSSGDGGEIL